MLQKEKLDRDRPSPFLCEMPPRSPESAHSLFPELASPGTIIQFQNGKRSLVLRAAHGELALVSWDGEKGLKETIHKELFQEQCANFGVRQLEPPGVSSLVPAAPLKKVEIPRWRDLSPGSLIVYPDGRCEEVLGTEPVPFKDASYRYVTSVVRERGNPHFSDHVRRSDKELAGPVPPVVIPRAPCSLWSPPQTSLVAPLLKRGVTPGVADRFMRSFALALDRLEEMTSEAVGDGTDRTTKETLRHNRKGSVDSPLERSLSELRQLHAGRKELESLVEGLIASSFLGKISDPYDPTLDRLCGTLDNCRFLKEPSAYGDVLKDVIRKLSQSLPGNGTSEHLNRPLRAVQEIMASVRTALAISPAVPAPAYTALARPDNLSDALLDGIYRLAEERRFSQDDPRVAASGIIIDNYYTPRYMRQIVEEGGRLITHHELVAGKSELTGFLLYFHPNQVPPGAKGIPFNMRYSAETACMDLICLSLRASLAAFQRLHDRMLVDLQHTSADWLYAEIMCKNEASFSAALINSVLPSCAAQVISASPDGTDTRWLCVRLPVNPALRNVLTPFLAATRESMGEEFSKQAKAEPTGLAPMSKQEQEETQRLVSQVWNRVQAPLFTRISLGSGNMTPAEFLGIRKILEEGCQGLQGVLSWGATLMLVKVDERQENVPRAGIHESIRKIFSASSEQLLLLGVNVYDKPPENAEIVSFEGEAGVREHYRIISGSEDDNVPYLTVEDPQVQFRMRYQSPKDGSFPFWQVEAERSAQIGRLFLESDPGAEKGSAAKRLTIFGSGGGTIGHEIRRRAIEEDSTVILIDGRDAASRAAKSAPGKREKSATETYIDDDDWRSAHANVHVVTSGAELRALLMRLGAVVPQGEGVLAS